MSASSERGKGFELKVRNITKRLLKIELGRDPQSGAGIHKADIKPRYRRNYRYLSSAKTTKLSSLKSGGGTPPVSLASARHRL